MIQAVRAGFAIAAIAAIVFAPAAAVRAEVAAARQAPAPKAEIDPASIYQLDSDWTSEESRRIKLGDLGGKPRVLAIFYSSCQYACPIIIGRMKAVQSALASEKHDGVGFVLITMDPTVDSPDKLRDYRARLELEGDWKLLQGDDDAIRELAAVLGFRYRRESDGSYSHSNMITVLDAQGRIVHQSIGTEPGVDDIVAAVKKVLGK
jgi:protein SCO1/2